MIHPYLNIVFKEISIMAMIDEIKEQTIKLKDMDNKQRFQYIMDYYKWYILGFIVGIACLISITSEIIKNSRPVYLFAEFIDCNLAFDETSTMKDDFIKEYNIDVNKTPVTFDYNTIIHDSALDANSNYATQVRVLAEYAAKELDIVCAPESLLVNEIDAGAYGNLEEVLPAGMLDELVNKGYELWEYTEEGDPDRNIPDKTYYGGFYIDNCEYLNNQGIAGVYTTTDQSNRPVLTIAYATQNPEHCIEFIKMITR